MKKIKYKWIIVLMLFLLTGACENADQKSGQAFHLVKFGAFYTNINSGEDFEKYSRTGDYADIIETHVALTMIDLDGNAVDYSWGNGPPDNVDQPKDKAIQVINYKAENVPVETMPYIVLKDKRTHVKAAIRTGDFTANANVILQSGAGNEWFTEK